MHRSMIGRQKSERFNFRFHHLNGLSGNTGRTTDKGATMLIVASIVSFIATVGWVIYLITCYH
jgi:hypothetical protein